MRTTINIFILFLICAIAGCASRSKIALDDTGNAGGDRRHTAPAPLAPVPSVINIPVEIKTDYIENIINNQLRGTIYQNNAFTIGAFSNVKITVRKNGHIKVQARGDELLYSFPLKISMRFSFTVSAFGRSHTEYQNAEAAFVINMRSKIKLQNDWRLITSTTVDGYRWTSDPVIKVRFVTIPIKSIADPILSRQAGGIGSIVDKSISAGLNVKDMVAPLWKKLQEPTEISVPDIPERLWLRFAPSEIYMTQPVGKGSSVLASLGIRAITETSMGGKPAPQPPKPLPHFKTPVKHDSSFAINLFTEIPFKQATTLSREIFVGKTFKSGIHRVKVHDIEISGTNEGRARLKMDLSGAVKGTVYVTGKAVYNESTQTLALEDFDFDVESKSQYHKAKNWLLKGIITSKMKPLLKFPLKKPLEDAKILVQKMLTDYELYNNIVLNGQIDSLAVRGVEVSENGFKAAVLANGTARVGIRE